jgi:hypothetical protein
MSTNTWAFAGPASQTRLIHKPFEDLWSDLVRVNQLKPTYFHAKKGQALIWAANLLHGGSRQTNPDLTRWSQVTHYYFDSCSYYTPMASDPFFGRIMFRQPQDIGTGAVIPNIYSGVTVPASLIRTMNSKSLPKRQIWVARMTRTWHRATHRIVSRWPMAAGLNTRLTHAWHRATRPQ